MRQDNPSKNKPITEQLDFNNNFFVTANYPLPLIEMTLEKKG
jgi:hypothetical protein